MKKTRPKILPKTKAKLQQEIHSECPFCQNQDVGCFEVHHIDENPENNDLKNLLMICPNCHTKITKGDIIEEKVRKIKNELPLINNKIEFVSATIDSKKCAWEVSAENDYAFFKSDNNRKSPFPIISFTLINHKSKTIVFKKIHLKIKSLPQGISGIPYPKVLKPLAKYQIQIKGERNVLILESPIHIPSNESFMFQVELSQDLMNNNERYEVQGRKVLCFTFEFSDSTSLQIPNLYLNCKSENEQMRIYTMR